MNALRAHVQGIGFWASAVPGWEAAQALLATGRLPENAPAKPAPGLLAANERRRAPESVAVALEVALAACEMAGADPATLPSVFASTHGDLGITDYMSQTLAGPEPASVSPTRFHNSVHNAAAGYWTIGAGCLRPATALSAWQATLAQGLLEALVQLAAGEAAVLLVAYDARAHGPLATVSPSTGLLGGAWVLAREGHGPVLEASLEAGTATAGQGPLVQQVAGNAMQAAAQLCTLLCEGAGELALDAGAGRVLRLRLSPAKGCA